MYKKIMRERLHHLKFRSHTVLQQNNDPSGLKHKTFLYCSDISMRTTTIQCYETAQQSLNEFVPAGLFLVSASEVAAPANAALMHSPN